MFTIDQIRSAHAKVKSGSDFPNYVKDLKQLGVRKYETFVTDGNTTYFNDIDSIKSGPKYSPLSVQMVSNKEKFQSDLKSHQQGNTDYPKFCKDAADAGVEKWVVDINDMTCSYLDKSNQIMVVEQIPG